MILLGKNLEFGLDVVFGVTYPVFNVALRGVHSSLGKNSVMDVLRETIFGSVDSV